ncbi:ribonuclease HII [Bacillus sp. 2205SS5-2]|uniref:ribonuclease HII n=1 Tax=Bacillus sp. 2205SS5-2 TaxID=3109031 RepID=UPI003FA5F798
MKTIKDIIEALQQVTDSQDPLLKSLEEDKRKGVQQAVAKWYREDKKHRTLNDLFVEMSVYERERRLEGFTFIAGIDEVGRGPLAGPVVASAVILPENSFIPGLNDSKKLSESRREELYQEIHKQAISVGIGLVSALEIDQMNIYEATKKAMIQAVHQLTPMPDYLLIDAMKLDLPIKQTSLIKGDGKSVSIAAASIVAKVTRDRLMKEYDKLYPVYGFRRHMGYGTSEHIQAINQVGPCEIHRRTFAPVKNFV